MGVVKILSIKHYIHIINIVLPNIDMRLHIFFPPEMVSLHLV